jgi:hypothetical protein
MGIQIVMKRFGHTLMHLKQVVVLFCFQQATKAPQDFVVRAIAQLMITVHVQLQR